LGQSYIDRSIQRASTGSFTFPLGVYPVEPLTPRAGYVAEFEPADGGEDPGDWEEWPDRYVYDVVVTATRLRALCRSLFALLPGRVYPILDVLGNDAYREVDPYIAYDPVGIERFIDVVHDHGSWLFEDGLVGFGAMSDAPFVYVYVDEHKVVTVRVESELKEQVEKTLAAFDLTADPDATGVDGASHEHRGVLMCPPDQPDMMTAEEIVEDLLDLWRLELNVDRAGNVDDAGKPLGVTGWRALVRVTPDDESEAERYAEVVITAGSLAEVEQLALDAVDGDGGRPASGKSGGDAGGGDVKGGGDGEASDAGAGDGEEGEDSSGPEGDEETVVVFADRVTPEQLRELAGPEALDGAVSRTHSVRWLT